MADIPRTSWTYYSTPRKARGYISSDFIYFIVPNTLTMNNYKIMVEDLSGKWKFINYLNKRVLLPSVIYSPYSKIAIVGVNGNGESVKYVGTLLRSASYILGPELKGINEIRPQLFI